MFDEWVIASIIAIGLLKELYENCVLIPKGCRTFKQLPMVDVIVEDGERNLEAAKMAAEELGYHPKVYREMPVLI